MVVALVGKTELLVQSTQVEAVVVVVIMAHTVRPALAAPVS
jgi:hypothetical protein